MILIQVANIAQKTGALSLQDAAATAAAVTFLSQKYKDDVIVEENVETPVEESSSQPSKKGKTK